ncbi:hypothetical protein GQ43DRAFT_256912 [Delitschia confertaspora ATCC 74209]|uniref:Uncharacterized protein n=1 Tax=Delitschia confertaspora ATCC 74209 TaxID=1513339 RepID=A0A9P4JGV3_9PLEO|nr:hypothetical protein GQ43DRAFT_256912 [Delitschia confertaspora ATCC 74209]
MADEYKEELDLDTILRRLAELPRDQPPIESVVPPQTFQTQPYDPSSESVPNHSWIGNDSLNALDPRLNNRIVPQEHRNPTPQSAPVVSDLIDSTRIIEWRQGLRRVSTIAQHNSNFKRAVQRLIKKQEDHVQDWAKRRQELIREQILKRQQEQKLRATLSTSPILSNSAPLRTPETDREELNRFDRKVYQCCRDLMKSQSSELKRLGVPFFGVRDDLIIDGTGDPSDTSDSVAGQPSNASGKITKGQLLDLQRQMLRHLEDMYKED